MAKKRKEEWKIYNNVFDNFTLRTVHKLSTKGLFDELKSPIEIGKEANVFSAVKDDKLVIVKIYRLESCNFNKMYDYIKADNRYLHLRKQRRQIIFAWVQREYRNLFIARSARVPVPTPFAFLNNVLVMDFIGEDGIAAPQLKDSSFRAPKKLFNEIIDYIIRLGKNDLIHGDLSKFNILLHNKPVFIDFSQSVTSKSSIAKELLKRDVKNVCVYFSKFIKVDYKKTYEYVVNKIKN